MGQPDLTLTACCKSLFSNKTYNFFTLSHVLGTLNQQTTRRLGQLVTITIKVFDNTDFE